MRRNWTRPISWLLCLCLVCGLLGRLPAQAAEVTSQPAQTGNLGDYAYTYDRWANPINSYLVSNGDGTITRVEFTGTAVAVETYDSTYTFLSGMLIPAELPLFGGFHSGENYNFLVFGQTNTAEDDTAEVIRVVSYTKDWQRVASASLYGANTTVPFDAGSLRFAEYGGYLYIRTAHEMYTSSDGLNHQANLTMNVRIADMVITDSLYQVMNNSWGYVSHSFNQFIAVDGTTLVGLDHGDAYPRSVVLTRYEAPAGQDKFLEPVMVDLGDGRYTYRYAQTLDVLPIAGSFGDNDTGVSLGGFECSDDAYLVAGNTVSQGDDYDPDSQRNIFIAVVDKDNFTAQGVTIRYLTSHTAGVTVSNPHFVQVADNKYCILWEEYGSETEGLRYAFVDGLGQLLGSIYTAQGVLSDCQPVVHGNDLVWYVTSASAPSFCTIDLDAPENVTHGCVYGYDFASYPSYDRTGALYSACAVCGQQGDDVVIPAIKDSDAYKFHSYITEPTCTEDGQAYYQWKDAAYYGVVNWLYGVPVPATGHQYEAGACTVCGESDPDYAELIDFAGMTMSLGNSLAANFVINTALLDGSGHYAVITKTYADGTEPVSVTIPQSQWQVYSGKLYYFTFTSVNAKEMTDEFTVIVYNAAGKQVSVTYTRTIEDYCYGLITKEEAKSSPDAERLALYTDILNYGAAAQNFFTYNTDNLANARVTEIQQTYATQDVVTEDVRVKGEGYMGSTLSLKNEILMNFVFTNATADQAAYAVYTFRHHDGGEESVTVPAEEFQAYGTSGQYMIVTGMKIADCNQVITVTLHDAQGNILSTSADSVWSYASRNTTKHEIYTAVLKLATSAYNFFH